MVALAVFSLAVLALIRLEGATIRGAGLIDGALLGGIVARTVAVETVTGATPPPLGVSAGVEVSGGRRWRWTRTVRPTGNAQIVRVDVDVADPAGHVVAHATMVRPPDRPALAVAVPS